MATASARRQALADLARARKTEGTAARLVRRLAIGIVIVGLVALILMWLLGFFSTPKEVLAVRTLVDEQVADLQRMARNELPFSSDGEAFGAMFAAMRDVPEGYRDQARTEIGRLFEARETAEVNSFFGLPPAERTAELDRRIQAEEKRRKEWESRRAERSADGGQTAAVEGGRRPSGGPPAGPGRGNRTEEGRNLRAKSRLDRTSAESRARRTEYRRLKDQRRIDLGLAPRR